MRKIEVENKVFGYSYKGYVKPCATFEGVFTKNGLRDVVFVKVEDKNYIYFATRSYVYGCVDHLYIEEAFEVTKEEGNEIYKEIKNSKFVSKKGKTFYKYNK